MAVDFAKWFVGEPRAQQVEALEQLSDNWDRFDVFVLALPVAVGKSKLGEAACRAAASKRGLHTSAAYVVNNNLLLEQLAGSTKGFRQLRAKEWYACRDGGSCSDRARRVGGHCKSYSGSHYAADGCPYLRDLRGARSAERLLVNQHIYLAHKLYRPVVVFDECHTLQALLQELAGRRLWRSTYRWPRSFETLDDVREWLDDPAAPRDEHVELLAGILDGSVRGYSVHLAEEELRGQPVECVKLLAVDVRDAPPVMWPPQVSKIILMSATISDVDVAALGLSGRRVCYISTGSPIPPERRPFVQCDVADLSYRGLQQPNTVERLAAFLLDDVLPQHRGERGFVHASYSLARRLQEIVGHHGRLRFHTRTNRVGEYDKWIADGSRDSVFVGSGMHEGVDLAGDRARFQLLTATPRRSVADPGLLYLAETDPAQYEWLTIREIAQAYGRVARSPDDFGVTISTDSSIRRELASPRVPTWLREAIVR